MKKILAIASSPEKDSNSTALLESFVEGVKENKNVEIEVINVNEIDMHCYCHDCKYGMPEEEKEFMRIAEKLNDIDALIIATPTYNFNIPANLKNFIDKIGFIALDYKNKNKIGQPIGKLGHLKAYFIVTGGTPNLFQKFTFFLYPTFYLRVAFAYYGLTKVKTKYVGGLKRSGKVQSNTKLLNKFRELGSKFA